MDKSEEPADSEVVYTIKNEVKKSKIIGLSQLRSLGENRMFLQTYLGSPL